MRDVRGVHFSNALRCTTCASELCMTELNPPAHIRSSAWCSETDSTPSLHGGKAAVPLCLFRGAGRFVMA